jgi:hypothetical protein
MNQARHWKGMTTIKAIYEHRESKLAQNPFASYLLLQVLSVRKNHIKLNPVVLG